MTVAIWTRPSFPTQDPASYKSNIDRGFMVSQRLVDAFAPHAQATPNMTVALDAGFTFYGGTLTEVAAQNTGAIAASSLAGITRIDRVVINQVTGAYSVVTGTSVAPSIPSGYAPVAQVAVTTASTAITSTMITDERAFPVAPKQADYQVFNTTAGGTWNKPVGFSTAASVLVLAWAGGGGGGSVGGGGGGACMQAQFRLADLTTAVAVTVGVGGTTAPSNGGNSAFGSYFTVYGGAAGSGTDGGGGGGIYAQSTGTNPGGAPLGGSSIAVDSEYGGGYGGAGTAGGRSVYGGGGGGDGAAGGDSFYGGGGGAGAGSTVGGVSVSGGNGGASGSSGAAPAGGGGRQAAGARGEVRVWVFS